MLREISLLDLMAIQVGCKHLSDLRHVDNFQRAQLARALERVAARDKDLFDWNNALEYLTGDNRQRDNAEQAKATLIAELSAPHGNGGEKW